MNTIHPETGLESGSCTDTAVDAEHVLFRHVLVPLDGSPAAESAVPFAGAVASAFASRVSLVRVVAVGEKRAATSQVDARLARVEAKSYLEDVAGRLRSEGLDVQVQVEEGPPGEVIVRLVRSAGCDLVVVTESGAGGAEAFALGGTSQKIVYGTGVSVLLVRGEPGRVGTDETGFGGCIAVLTDGSERSEWAICAAATLARGHAELVLAHAVPSSTTSFSEDEEHAALEERLRAALRDAASTYLEAMCGRLASPDLRVRTRIVEGPSVTRAIQDFLAEERPTLVVVSAHGASGAAPWPYGGVATNLLLHSPYSVLALQDRPPEPRAPAAEPATRAERGDRP